MRHEIRFYDPNGANGWLANFSPHKFYLDGVRWKSVEHYFQASKFRDSQIRAAVKTAKSPWEAKRLAKTYSAHKRSDWTEIRKEIMSKAIRAKFTQNLDLQERLLNTLDRRLVECTDDDSYWGESINGKGVNTMGELLMKLREQLHTSLMRLGGNYEV